MGILIRMEIQKLKRSKIAGAALFAVLLLAAVVLVSGLETYTGPDLQYGRKGLEAGTRYLENAGWFMDEAEPWAVFFVLPAVAALLGSYMICREKEEDTEKILRMIPVSERKMTAAKLAVTFFWCLLLCLVLFLTAFLTESVLHAGELTAGLVLEFLKEYLIMGAGIFAAVSPVIAVSAQMKKYWYAPAAAEFFSVLAFFAARTEMAKSIYPVTAIFQVSGYMRVPPEHVLISGVSLLVCMAAAALILWRQNPEKSRKSMI